MLLGNRGSGPYRVPLSLGPLLVRGAVDLATTYNFLWLCILELTASLYALSPLQWIHFYWFLVTSAQE